MKYFEPKLLTNDRWMVLPQVCISCSPFHCNTTGIISGAGTTYTSGLPEFTLGDCGVLVAQSLVFCVLWIICKLFVLCIVYPPIYAFDLKYKIKIDGRIIDFHKASPKEIRLKEPYSSNSFII